MVIEGRDDVSLEDGDLRAKIPPNLSRSHQRWCAVVDGGMIRWDQGLPWTC